jgi:hypothetical protein
MKQKCGTDRIYRRTDAGFKAWESPDSGLPAGYRQILGVISTEINARNIRQAMRGHSDRQVSDWLDELDTLGFIELIPASRKSADFSAIFHAILAEYAERLHEQHQATLP